MGAEQRAQLEAAWRAALPPPSATSNCKGSESESDCGELPSALMAGEGSGRGATTGKDDRNSLDGTVVGALVS
jgi:hypothetical protein